VSLLVLELPSLQESPFTTGVEPHAPAWQMPTVHWLGAGQKSGLPDTQLLLMQRSVPLHASESAHCESELHCTELPWQTPA
jgi:hypothetical protein